MRTLLALLLLTSTALAERGWFIVPESRLGAVQDSLSWTITKYDTVWRDSSWIVKNHLDQDSVVKVIKQKVVQRTVGGYAVAGERKVSLTDSTSHRLFCVMVYTKKARFDALQSDSTIFSFEMPDTVIRTGAVPALTQASIKRFWKRNGFSNAKINAEDWTVWSEVRKSTLNLMNMKRKDLDGTEVSRRED